LFVKFINGEKPMEEEIKVGCARPTGGPVGEQVENHPEQEEKNYTEEMKMIKVGQKSPGFYSSGVSQR
jgi:peroxiredoxin (alkyl hydroperoxide reductase subunit C)